MYLSKVLLVNDSAFENIVMKDILEDIGHDVEISNEFEVYNHIQQFQPEVIIVNLIMKHTTGDVIIKNIKRQKSEPICILSSSNELDMKDFKDNKVDYIIKIPVNKEMLNEMFFQFEPCKKENTSISFCPFCGGKINQSVEKFLFCPYCGHRIQI